MRILPIFLIFLVYSVPLKTFGAILCSTDCEEFQTICVYFANKSEDCQGTVEIRANNKTYECNLKVPNVLNQCNPSEYNYVVQEKFSGGLIRCSSDPCEISDLFYNIQRLLRFIVFFAFWFAVIISVTGAFMWMFGGPFPNLAAQGKSMIKTAIIGYILLLMVGIIFDLVLEFIGPKFKF